MVAFGGNGPAAFNFGRIPTGIHFDRDGQPMTLMEWCLAHVDGPGRKIAHDDLDGGVAVETDWLGLDHRFYGNGPPIIFETMIFGGPHDEWQRRYCTETDAKASHARIVACLKAGGDPDDINWNIDPERT